MKIMKISNGEKQQRYKQIRKKISAQYRQQLMKAMK
jgi:hypothetical protein